MIRTLLFVVVITTVMMIIKVVEAVAGTTTSTKRKRILRTGNKIPSFPINELLDYKDDIIDSITSTGIFSITMTTSNYRNVALRGLCHCYDNNNNNWNTNNIMNYQYPITPTTLRTTIGIESSNNDNENHNDDDDDLLLNLMLLSSCNNDDGNDNNDNDNSLVLAIKELRNQVKIASDAIISFLDNTIFHSNSTTTKEQQKMTSPLLQDIHGKSYTSLSSIIQSNNNAKHLEHFHIYEEMNDNKESNNKKTTTNNSVLIIM